MAKNGFIVNGDVLQLWANDAHIANLTTGGFKMVGGKFLGAGTIQAAGGNRIGAAQAVKITDPTGGSIVDTNGRAQMDIIINALEGAGISAT